MNDIRFDGRVAIVTGAGGGVGRAYALELASRGAKVVVNDLGGSLDGSGKGTSAADKVVAEIKDKGGTAVASYDSVSTMQGGAAIVQTALDEFGTVDIVINNAGILRDKSFLKMTEEDWDQVVAVHLKGAFCVTQPAVKAMREKQYGRIIFTSSTSGLFGNFGQTNYAAAKLGLVGFMNALKLEVAKYNILVNSVAPNAYSRMTEGIFPVEYKDKMAPEFNVPIVMYLCSEQCTTTGMAFMMNAGWFARAAVVASPGVCLGDASRYIPAEEVRDHMSPITDLSQAAPHDQGASVYTHCAPLFK